MQGSANQMMSPQMPQAHLMGLNQMQPGSVAGGNMPQMGGFPNNMANMQGAPGAAGLQNFPFGGMFNRPPQGQMPPLPGLNPYQVGNDFFCPLYSLR